MKARGCRPSAFIVSRCLDTPMKQEARVLEITSHDHSVEVRSKSKQLFWGTLSFPFVVLNYLRTEMSPF